MGTTLFFGTNFVLVRDYDNICTANYISRIDLGACGITVTYACSLTYVCSATNLVCRSRNKGATLEEYVLRECFDVMML